MKRHLALALTLGGWVFGPGAARAEPTAEQRVAAQALFDDARTLMAAKRFVEACLKFDESLRLDRGLGTLLNLADCQAQLGKTASAWATFLDAAYEAKNTGQANRERIARERAAALEPKLSRLTVLVAAPSGDDVAITRDGQPVPKSILGTPVPVDPGEHTLRATAPGKRPWEQRLRIETESQRITVSVPSLEDAPPPNVDGLRIGGIVLTIVGAGGLVTAAAFTGLAKQKVDASNAPGECTPTPAGTVCPGASYSTRVTAHTDGNIATGAWVAGGAVTAAGVALLALAARRQSGTSSAWADRAPSVTVEIGARGRGVLFTGSF